MAGLLLCAMPAHAQAPPSAPPSPPPDRLRQDDLDLQARSNVVQGSGARAFGMGGAFLARADDATAASWNPAGLSYLRRPELSVVWAGINKFTAAVRNVTTNDVLSDDSRRGHGPDFLAAAWPFEFRSVTGAAQVSFQRVISFDGHRTIVTPDKNSTVDSSGGFDVLALGTGLQFSRKARIGATLNRWFNGYHQSRLNIIPAGTQLQDLDFGISGWNVHVGAIVSPWESLNLGFVAKTPFFPTVNLKRARTDVRTSPTEDTTHNEDARKGSLEFPGAIGVGASWRPRSALTLSADFTRTFWSNATIKNFFTLPRVLPGQQDEQPPPLLPGVDLFDSLPYPSLFDYSGQGQTDTQQIRAGAEYVVIWGPLKVPLRGGYFLDTQYFRGPDGTAPRFKGWTAGAGLIVGPLLLDVAYVRETGHYVGFYNADGAIAPARNVVKSHRLYVSMIYRRPR